MTCHRAPLKGERGAAPDEPARALARRAGSGAGSGGKDHRLGPCYCPPVGLQAREGQMSIWVRRREFIVRLGSPHMDAALRAPRTAIFLPGVTAKATSMWRRDGGPGGWRDRPFWRGGRWLDPK